LKIGCLYNGNTCPTARHQIFDSAYALDPDRAQEEKAYWRFDLDFGLYGLPVPSSLGDLSANGPELDGLGWAHTKVFGGQDLSTKYLAGTPLGANGTYSDASSHYFIQDPHVRHVTPIPFPPICPPPAGCGFSATSWLDPVCLTCGLSLSPTWLLVEPVAIAQMTGGMTLDASDLVDPGLASLLRDPSLVTVPVGEPKALLEYRGNAMNAVFVDSSTLVRGAAVYAGPDGLAALPLGFGDYDPPAEPRAFAASALEDSAYAVQQDPGAGEQLLVLPLMEPTLLPVPQQLQGIDGVATPRSLAYRADDGQLYLLDQVGNGPRGWLRIVRIDPATAQATVLARWRYWGRHDRVYLSVNDPGDLVLAGSGRKLPVSLLMTLAPEQDGVQLTGWRTIKGRLIAPPDTRGDRAYSLLLTDKNDIASVVEVPGSTLHQPAHGAHKGRLGKHGAWWKPSGIVPWCD